MGSSFDLIAQEMQKQQRIMEEMVAENRRLRQQLADLRAGKGIFLEVNGSRIELKTLISTSSPQPTGVVQEFQRSAKETSQSQTSKVEDSTQESITKSTTAPLAESQAATSEKRKKQPTFLEEIMLDEFQSALTSPMATSTQQTVEKKQEKSEEEQRAELRRELMGSYILE